MFWVMFDTGTKRDYYRDVHNLVALPSGSMLKYDYNQKHLSGSAIEEAGKSGNFSKDVLVAYAQTKNFKKGDADPIGPIPYEQGVWVATRIARLHHLRLSVDRYYFYLEMREYPAADDKAFGAIVQALAAAQDIPFVKWVAMSDLDVQFDSLNKGTACKNWASIVNRMGTSPSQFSGDAFWRIAKITSGGQKSLIEPLLREHPEPISDTKTTTDVEVVFPINELDRIKFQIEGRMPDSNEEPRDKELEAVRTITCETAPDSPLKDLNHRELTLRRYTDEPIETEVRGTDRIDAQYCDLTMKTGPVKGPYPIGPELSLRFEVTKKTGRGYFAVILAIISVILLILGSGLLKEHTDWSIVCIIMSVVFGTLAGFLWSGRIKLPGGK